ncbi:MAG TPA: hypothetical protein VJ063_00475 [Verrucomicrobiae bacterium]|nr:hypothetical protein [Verrucomicrobiae bacterium]
MKTLTEKKPVVVQPAPANRSNYALWTALLVGMLAIIVVASVKVQQGGWLAGEADMFLVDHNNPHRPFLSKVLAPHSHDASHYQARELSHFFEHFDALFINWSVKQGFPHFLSITSFAFLVALSLVHWRKSTRYLGMDPLIVLMLIAMFWTAPSSFFSGPYIRVAKQGASFLLLVLCWRVITCIGEKPANPPSTTTKALLWVQTFLLTLAMCWMDRQGYFLAGVLMLTLLAFWVGPPIPYRWVLISAMVAGLAAHTIYGRYIGPDLIRQHTGFSVSFEYQKLPWGTFFEHFFRYIWDGIALMGNTFRWYFGNLTGGLTLFVWAAMAWLFSRVKVAADPRPGSLQFKTFFGILFIGWLALLIFMNSAMVLRHEPLIWPDVRTHYYWIPTTTLVLLGCTLAVYVLQRNFTVPIWLLRVALAALVISNISALPEHNRIARGGHLQGYIAAAPHLLNAIRELSNTPEVAQPKEEFDAAKLSRIEGDFNAILKNPLAQPNMTVQDFVFSSHFYNYLRSKRNLQFRQPP